MLNCAVIGLGIGEQHARALLTNSSVKLAAVCDIDHQKALNFIQKYNLDPNLVKSFSEIISDKNIGIVSIASFDDEHYHQIKTCLHHGKHVFVEKPVCQNKNQLDDIYFLWASSGLGLSSNLILRKAPLYIWLDNLISSGEMGEIYAMDMEYLYGRIHKITDEWRAEVDDYSVMAGGGIHLVDLMMRFMKQRPLQVQSCVNKIATRETQFRYHDYHTATFHFGCGVITKVTANFGCMHRHQHVVRVFGTKATFIYDDMGARIHWNRDENALAEKITLASKPIEKGSLLLDFVSSILKNDYNKEAKKEFDLMCAITASDKAIEQNNRLIDIEYY